MKRWLFILIVCVVAFSQSCVAVDVQARVAEEIGAEQLWDMLPETLQKDMQGFNVATGENWQEVWSRLQEKAVQTLFEQVHSIWKPAVRMLVIVVFFSVLHGAMPGDKQSFPLLLAGSVAIISMTLADTHSFFYDGVQAVRHVYDFSTALLPCMAGASVIAGATISAGVKYTAAALFMNMLLNFCNSFLVPLVSVYLICIIGNTVFEQRMMRAVADFIHWVCMTILTGGVVIFTAYIGVAGLMASAGDVMATRITKTALTAGLPLVGKIISDTASTLVAGAALMRNGIGLFGLLAVLGILMTPFLSMGLRYLLFKGVGELAKLFPNHKFSALIQGIASAFGMVVAVIGTGFIMIFLTLISFMQISGGA